MVEEVGGIVTGWWGRGLKTYARTGALIVGNPACHAFLLQHLGSEPRKVE